MGRKKKPETLAKEKNLLLTAETIKLGETRILHFEEDDDTIKHCTITRKRNNLYDIIITIHSGRSTIDVGNFQFTLQQLKELKFWLI